MQFFQSTRALHENEWEYVETVTDASCQFEYYICVSQAQLRFFFDFCEMKTRTGNSCSPYTISTHDFNV